MYEAGLKYILGLTIEKGYLSIKPCIPCNWKEYKIHYKYGNSMYNIIVKNQNEKNREVETMIVDNMIIDEKKIKLEDDNRVHNVEIIM